MLNAERSVQSYRYHTHLAAVSIEVINSFLYCIAYAAHCNYNLFRIGSAVVIEQLIICTYFCVNLVHVHLTDFGDRIICRVTCFSCLEVNIAVLSRTSLSRMLGVKRLVSEFSYCVPVNHFRKIVVIPACYLLIFV